MHSVHWRRLDLEGTDRATLVQTETGYLLLGHARFQATDGTYDLHYSADVDLEWRTVQARVNGIGPQGQVSMHIATEPGGIWRLNGSAIPEIQGCIDVDLAFTPATNLISIRRLALGPGQSAEVIAAWLDFPTSRLQPLRQIYQHQADGRYRYDCPGIPFESLLEVDSFGFVTSYPPLWAPAHTG